MHVGNLLLVIQGVTQKTLYTLCNTFLSQAAWLEADENPVSLAEEHGKVFLDLFILSQREQVCVISTYL